MRGFRLREEVVGESAPPNDALLVDDLVDMFDRLDASLVRDVFHQAQSPEEAVVMLSSMVPRDDDGGGGLNHQGPGQPEEEGASTSPADACRNEHQHDSDAEDDRIVSMWDDVLPMDCKRIIWGLLSSKDMARAAATSREWHEFTQEMRSWRTFLTVQRYLQPSALEGLVGSHEQAEKIKIDYRKASSATACDAGVFYRTVRRGQEARYVDHRVDMISRRVSQGETGDGTGARTENHQQPKDIRVVLVNSSEACQFDKYELESLLDALEYVEDLCIVDSPSMDDDAVQPLVGYRTLVRRDREDEQSSESLRPLRRLSLIHTRLSNRGLRELVLNLPSAELDVSRNRRITELVSPPARSHLRFLTARSLPNLTKVNLSLGGTRLNKLDLSENHALAECIITASDSSQSMNVRQFHELNLSGCKNLRMLMLDCPDLTTLTCARCRRLQLVGGFVHGLNLPALETLNVNACREASDEGINSLLGKVRVKHLNVGGCIRLTRLQVAFREGATGCTLDAYGCGRLGLIEIRGSSGVEKVVTTGCGAAGGVRVVKLAS